jgi:hypothetical protein
MMASQVCDTVTNFLVQIHAFKLRAKMFSKGDSHLCAASCSVA